jgi:hypothetical protein
MEREREREREPINKSCLVKINIIKSRRRGKNTGEKKN